MGFRRQRQKSEIVFPFTSHFDQKGAIVEYAKDKEKEIEEVAVAAAVSKLSVKPE